MNIFKTLETINNKNDVFLKAMAGGFIPAIRMSVS